MKFRYSCALLLALLFCVFSVSCHVKKTSTFENNTVGTPPPSMPEGELFFYLDDLSGTVGDTVTVRLNVYNNPGIAGFSLTLGYDSEKLEFVSGESQIENGFPAINSQIPGKLRLMCTKSGGNTIVQNGVCFTVTFKIKENTVSCQTTLELSLADEKDTVYTFDDGVSTRISCMFHGCTLTITKK